MVCVVKLNCRDSCPEHSYSVIISYDVTDVTTHHKDSGKIQVKLLKLKAKYSTFLVCIVTWMSYISRENLLIPWPAG